MVQNLLVRKIIKTEVEVPGLGVKIREAQQKSGLSIEALTRELGISRSYWHSLVREKADLSWELMQKIEEVLEINLGVEI
jgi:ribosome-binding protein aMBF1 (putative translation factor)